MIEHAFAWCGRNLKLPGVSRLIRLAYPSGMQSRRWVAGVRTRADGLRMDVDSRHVIDWEVCFRGSYESLLVPVFEAVLAPGGFAVDIGANVGVHTLTMARIVGSEGQVFAYEPNPDVFERLVRNVALNELNCVTCYDTALGEVSGTVELRVPRSDTAEAENPGLASVKALDTPHDLVEIVVDRLDSLMGRFGLDRLDLIKIDVQGYETFVFRGMREILQHWKPAVVFEYEDWAWEASQGSLGEVISILEAADYRLWSLTTGAREQKRLLDTVSHNVSHIEILALPRDGARTGWICEQLNLERNG